MKAKIIAALDQPARQDAFEDLPRELRERLLSLLPTDLVGDASFERVTVTDYSYTDETGVTRRFETLDEMPPEVRELFERHGSP